MSRHKVSCEALGRGVVDSFCDEDAPEIVEELSRELAHLIHDHPQFWRVDLTVTVFTDADQ